MLSLVRLALPDHQSARWAAPSTVEPCSHPTGLAAAPASISILPLPTTITRLRSGRLRRAVSVLIQRPVLRPRIRGPILLSTSQALGEAWQSRTITPRRAVIRRRLAAVKLPVYSADRERLSPQR